MIPHTDWERLALLKEIECGDKIVIPVNIEHAEMMLKLAQIYINEHKQEMLDILKS
jgi:hypothetical protein